MKLNLVQTALFFALLFASNFAGVALAEDFLDEGKKMYAAKRFEEARHFFEAEIKTNPKNTIAHYLLANVLLELKQTADAQKEYQKSEELDPNGIAGQYSRLALSSISGKSSRSNAVVQPGQANYQSTPLLTFPGTASPNTKSATINSAKKISSEVARLVQQQQAECDAKVKDILNGANDEVNRLKAEMQERIAENGPPQYVRTFVPMWGGGFRQPLIKTYDPEPDNQIIRQDYAARIDRVGQRARREADQVIESYKQKQLALEDSALTLDKSYVNKNPTGNIILNPTGTDIYNRNYQTGDTASGNPVPVMLAPPKLLPTFKKGE